MLNRNKVARQQAKSAIIGNKGSPARMDKMLSHPSARPSTSPFFPSAMFTAFIKPTQQITVKMIASHHVPNPIENLGILKSSTLTLKVGSAAAAEAKTRNEMSRRSRGERLWRSSASPTSAIIVTQASQIKIETIQRSELSSKVCKSETGTKPSRRTNPPIKGVAFLCFLRPVGTSIKFKRLQRRSENRQSAIAIDAQTKNSAR